MRVIPALLCIFLWANGYTQVLPCVFYKSDSLATIIDRRYYSKTDFSIVDTVNLWNYDIDTTFHGDPADSIKPLGRIFFFRTSPIIDTYRKQIYAWDWVPYLSFRIYFAKDSVYCFQKSKYIRLIASCIPPETGGDVIEAGNLILVNNSVCTVCLRYDLGLDNCRPVINFIVSKIETEKVLTIEDFTNQLIIKKGRWLKPYD